MEEKPNVLTDIIKIDSKKNKNSEMIMDIEEFEFTEQIFEIEIKAEEIEENNLEMNVEEKPERKVHKIYFL